MKILIFVNFVFGFKLKKMNANLECLNEYVQEISADRRYWMVRTMGGLYYQNFITDHFIAIGHNEYLLHNIRQLPEDLHEATNALRRKVIEHDHAISRPGHIASQILRFCREIQVGDIVVVPSHGSEICICEVSGEVYENPNATDFNGECPFMKRLPVNILHRKQRGELPPKAQLMFNSRHPISDISAYAVYLDVVNSDYYNKDGETHVALKINTNESVSVSDFYNIQLLFRITEEYCKVNGIEGNANEVEMKVQMESKGMLHFISHNKKFLALVAMGILFINGGGLRVKHGNFELDLSTDGIFQNISEYMDRSVDRKMRESIKNSLDRLQIKTPEDYEKAVIELYKTQNENRKQY